MGTPGTTVREVERKYETAAGVALPPLDGLPTVADVGSPGKFELEATYFDTTDLRLTARNVRLRRRTGGSDAGWHVKFPSARGDVLEVHRPLGRATRTVPAALARLVDAVARGGSLRPVLRMTTARVERSLLDAEGNVLALVAEDEVSAFPLLRGVRGPGNGAWREVEVELAGGGEDLLDAVEARLLAAGLRPATSGSKAVRALGAQARPAWPALPGPLTRKSPAGAVVSAYLREQATAILEYDPKMRLDEPDALHKMRVATRRLRSALRTFGPVLDRAVTDPVSQELRWLAAELGTVRDAEVLRERLLRDAEALPAELLVGPVHDRVRGGLSGDYARAREKVLAELSGERYFALLDALDGLVVLPPLTALAGEPAQAVVPALVGKSYRRLTRRLAAVPPAAGGAAAAGNAVADTAVAHIDEERNVALHEARKDAKRLRYAGESVAGIFGSDATQLATRAEAVQEVLGEHQDGVVMAELLRTLAAQAEAAGENTFTYGVLVGLERCRAAAVEDSLDGVRRQLRAKKVRRWLS